MGQPTIIQKLLSFMRNILGSGNNQTDRQPEKFSPQSSGQPAAMALPQPVTRKVSLIIYNPTVPAVGNPPLTQAFGWSDPDQLIQGLIADLKEISYGYANYEIAERIVLNEFPVKMDGFQYTGAQYLRCWQARSGFHQPDDVNYHALLSENNIIPKIQSGVIDEVWTVSFPYAGFYESRMAGPGAFWCNAPPLENTAQAGRRFVIMAFNYERGVGEMLESYGHRAESILQRVFERIPDYQNLWKRFTLYDKVARGQAEVGNVHFAPNSQRDYDWGNPSLVKSRWRTWLNYPNLNGEAAISGALDWGNGDIRAHHKWWFSLMPHIRGQMGAISNNWWEYIVDPDRVH